MPKLIIGIDLGGTKIATGLANCSGKLLHHISLPTEAAKGPDAVIKNIKNSILKVLEEKGTSLKEVCCLGVGAPGPILYKEGVIVNPPNLPGWHKVPLKKILEKEIKKPVILENDANAAALGEWRFGAGRGTKNMIYITVSTGIGGGIILEGKLYRGTSGTAGEIGHTTIDPDGPKCGCGNYGCLEALASGSAIAKRAGRDAITVEKEAKAGNREAIKIVKETAEYLGIGIANLVNLFNPEMVVVGGGVAKMGEMLFKPVRETVRKRALKTPASAVKIVPPKLGSKVGVMGAIALCL